MKVCDCGNRSRYTKRLGPARSGPREIIDVVTKRKKLATCNGPVERFCRFCRQCIVPKKARVVQVVQVARGLDLKERVKHGDLTSREALIILRKESKKNGFYSPRLERWLENEFNK